MSGHRSPIIGGPAPSAFAPAAAVALGTVCAAVFRRRGRAWWSL